MPKQKLSEKEIQKWILDYLLANRIGFFWRNNTVGVYDPTRKCYRKNKSQVNGIPDILGILYGQFVAIECKKQGRKVLDENQKIFKDKFELNEMILMILFLG